MKHWTLSTICQWDHTLIAITTTTETATIRTHHLENTPGTVHPHKVPNRRFICCDTSEMTFESFTPLPPTTTEECLKGRMVWYVGCSVSHETFSITILGCVNVLRIIQVNQINWHRFANIRVAFANNSPSHLSIEIRLVLIPRAMYPHTPTQKTANLPIQLKYCLFDGCSYYRR